MSQKMAAAATADLLTANVALLPAPPALPLPLPQTMGVHVITGGDIDTYRVTFTGDEPAVVTAWESGDLDLFIYDSDGLLVAHDPDTDDSPLSVLSPPHTEASTLGRVNAADYARDRLWG